MSLTWISGKLFKKSAMLQQYIPHKNMWLKSFTKIQFNYKTYIFDVSADNCVNEMCGMYNLTLAQLHLF